jgi:hypothetical protein
MGPAQRFALPTHFPICPGWLHLRVEVTLGAFADRRSRGAHRTGHGFEPAT